MSNEMEQNNEASLQSFKVFVRVRPIQEKELILIDKLYSNIKTKNFQKNILIKEDNLLFVIDPDCMDYNGRKERSFVFDDIFLENTDNLFIFEKIIKQNVDNFVNGYNTTVFAYGITGTGKTHTIFGELQKYVDYDSFDDKAKFSSNMGICVLAIDYLFHQIESMEEKLFYVKISYLEIYNEQVIDLLVEQTSNLMIVEDVNKGIIVPDLTEYNVKSSKELINLIIKGNAKRTMAATSENAFSSRSHAILQIIIEQKSKFRDTKEEYLISKFLLVDLAGSERSGLEKGIRSHEGKNINKSLLSLGNCINILSDKSKKGAFVPYRDSKLTRLLKDSLSGNIMSVMIACVSPSPTCYDETVNTLKYAMKARKIEKTVHKNTKEIHVHISQYKEIIDSLKGEIEQLKKVIKNQQIAIQNTNLSENNLRVSLDKSSGTPENDKSNNSNSKDNSTEKNIINGDTKSYSIDNKSKNNELSFVQIDNNTSSKINITKKAMTNKGSSNMGNSVEIQTIKKNTYNNKKSNGEFPKEISEGSNLLLFSNNASLLSNQMTNNSQNYNKSLGNVNRSNGRASSSVSRNNAQGNNLNNSNLSGNNQVSSKHSGTMANATKNNSLLSNYTRTNMKKSKKYSEMSRYNMVGSFSFTDNEKHINSSMSPKGNQKSQLTQKNKIYPTDNYVNYRKFMVKNGDDEYDIDEFARNVDNLQNDKTILEEIIEKGPTDRIVSEKYRLVKDCCEKYLEIINDKLVENIEQSMVLKINFKEILDLNLANNDNIRNLNNQLYNLEKMKIDFPGKSEETEVKIKRVKDDIKNIQNAIDENDKMRFKISESLQKNENKKKSLKLILLKFISRGQQNSEFEEALNSIQKEKEELEKKNINYQENLKNFVKEKEKKDTKVGEVLSEVDILKKLLEEKEKKIKEISARNNRQNDFITKENIIDENITEEDNYSIRLSEKKSSNPANEYNAKRFINKDGYYAQMFKEEKSNLIQGKQKSDLNLLKPTNNNNISPLYDSKKNNNSNTPYQADSLTQNIINIRNNLISETNNSNKNFINNLNTNLNIKEMQSNDNKKYKNSGNIINPLKSKRSSNPSSIEMKNPGPQKINLIVNNPTLKVNSNVNSNNGNTNSNNKPNFESGNLTHNNQLKNISSGQKINSLQAERMKKLSNNVINKENKENKDNKEFKELKDNKDINEFIDERDKQHNFIPISNNLNTNQNIRPRGHLGSMSRSPKNRNLVNNLQNIQYNNTHQANNIITKEKDLHNLVVASKNKMKEYDKIIEMQLNDMQLHSNNFMNKKPKELKIRNKKFKNHSTEANPAKIGGKKFPFFNHNGVFKFKINPNKKQIRTESVQKIEVDKLQVNNSLNLNSESNDDENNLNEFMENQQNNMIEDYSELEILRNLDKNFENPRRINFDVKSNKNVNNFDVMNSDKNNLKNVQKKEEIEKNKKEVNNVFLNNYDFASKSNNYQLDPNNNNNANLLEISEIHSLSDKNCDISYTRMRSIEANQKVSDFRNINKNINNNQIDDLTLILSPKAVDGVSSSVNISNIDFKSNLFVEKKPKYNIDDEKNYFLDNPKNDINVFLNNQNLDSNSNFQNFNNKHLENINTNNNFANQNEILKNHGNSNVNLNKNNRINNINVQKFINKAGNNFSSGNPINVNPSTKDPIGNNSSSNFNPYQAKMDLELKKNFADSETNLSFVNLNVNNDLIKSSQNPINAINLGSSENKGISKQKKDIISSTNEFNIHSNFPKNNLKNFINNTANNPNENQIISLKDNSKTNTNVNNFKEKRREKFKSDLNEVKFTDLYNIGNVFQSNLNVQSHHSNEKVEKTEKQVNLLKQARLERHTHRRVESANFNEDILPKNLVINKENRVKSIDSSSFGQEKNENCPGNLDSNKVETKGFNKNTLDFFNGYKKTKNTNFKSNEMNLNLPTARNNRNIYNNFYQGNELSNEEQNNVGTNLNTANDIYENRHIGNFTSYNNTSSSVEKRNNMIQFTSDYHKKFCESNSKNIGLDIVNEGSLDIMDEDKMTIEEDIMRNVSNSINPKLLNSIDKKY